MDIIIICPEAVIWGDLNLREFIFYIYVENNLRRHTHKSTLLTAPAIESAEPASIC
jgi:hypothetical protein